MRIARRETARTKYTWFDWAAGGFSGPPPWRRGYQPLYLVISLVLFFGLLAVFWLIGRGGCGSRERDRDPEVSTFGRSTQRAPRCRPASSRGRDRLVTSVLARSPDVWLS